MSFDEREGVELAFVALVVERPEVAPINLEPFAGRRFHAHEGAGLGMSHTHALQVFAQDAVAPAIAGGVEALEDDDAGSARVLFEQVGNERLKGIELRRARAAGRRGHRRLGIHSDGAHVQVKLASDAPQLNQ